MKEWKTLRNRDLAIIESYRDGLSLDGVGALFGLTPERVRQILHREGAEVRSKSDAIKLSWENGNHRAAGRRSCARKPYPQHEKRNARVLKMRDEGKTYNDIAVEVGVSRNVVAGIIHREKINQTYFEATNAT